MSVRVCHPFGNPNSYNAAIGFLETGDLQRFHTSIYAPLGLQRRRHLELPRQYVTTYPTRELIRLGAAILPVGPWNGRRQGFVDWVTRSFDENTAKALATGESAVYCYEDSADRTFQRARDAGILRIYELPTPYYREKRRLFEIEGIQEPELNIFLKSSREPSWKRERKDQELLAADVIVVPSRFVQQSVERFLKPKAPFIVIPYGSDVRVAARVWSLKHKAEPLRLLFVGALGPGKGLHILFAALAKLHTTRYRLTLVGRWNPGFAEWLRNKYPIKYEWLGQLAHAEVYQACRQAHLFLFPSLSDGFGLVILEAMASGIPVMTTDQTAGPEIIEDGVDGWIVPAGDVESLRARLESVLEERNRLPEMGAAARRKALTLNWKKYRETLCANLASVSNWSPAAATDKCKK